MAEKVLFMTDFSYRLDKAGDKVIDWRCTNTKSECKARIRTFHLPAVSMGLQIIHKRRCSCIMANERSKQVFPQVNAQNISAQLMSRVSEIYRKSCAVLMAFFCAVLMSTCAEMMNPCMLGIRLLGG